MALPSKLFRFKIELSDLDNSVYKSLDFRVAQHPSETLTYLLTRVLAYSLSFEDGIEFSPTGLADPDAATIRVVGYGGSVNVWIEIGNPSVRKLHKASKAAKRVKIYTYKDPQVLLNELNSEDIHRKEELEVFSIPPKFLEQLERQIKKENKWTLIYQDQSLMVNGEGFDLSCEVGRHQAN